MNKDGGLELAPLRTLDDFILESARFQIPNINDLDKWGRRVSSNLLYYQTNYFLMQFIIFVIVGVIHPTQMTYGMIVTIILFGLVTYITNERFTAAKFKKKRSIITIALVLTGGYVIAYLLKYLIVFMLGIFLPICVTFIHASFRLRNIKNKIVNRVETLGLKRTPMGMFLEELGLENDLF